ncbi:MAG: DUF1573 domain-containing protein [Chryseotalea sp.]|jgi:hypothetical protein
MKWQALIFLGWMISVSVVAQRKETIQFDSKEHDFGIIKETGGLAVHRFEFTNFSLFPVKIVTVTASCGCTSPDWTKEIIEPGKTGSITASFDPRGRPGYFSKTIEVKTDADANVYVLTIKGTVSTNADAERFKESIGSLQFISTAINMGRVKMSNDWLYKDFEIRNASKEVLMLKYSSLPHYITIDFFPKQIPAQTQAVLRVGFNPKKKNQYGFLQESISIETSEKEEAVKALTFFATVEENFEGLTPDDKVKAPRIYADNKIDLGNYNGQNIKSRFTITNAGKSPLKLLAVQPNCTCIQFDSLPEKIEAGKSVQINFTFSGEHRKGTLQKFITLYTNDPNKPVERVMVTIFSE